MAKRELGPAALRVAQAVAAALPDGDVDVVVGVSGGADSMALALGAHWAATRSGGRATAVSIDHGLQLRAAEAAERAIAQLRRRGMPGEVVPVGPVAARSNVEAAARDLRLNTLSGFGVPVLLGHTMDDQAETVLLGLLRGSGIRSLAGMAPVRDRFLRPLLGLRRADSEAACREWGVDVWADPMNDDRRFARVQARAALRTLEDAFGRDLVPALARTASLARADADLLDALAADAAPASGAAPDVADLAGLPDALRRRVLHAWLAGWGVDVEFAHVEQVDRLVTAWRGQGSIAVPGGTVTRVAGRLHRRPPGGPDQRR